MTDLTDGDTQLDTILGAYYESVATGEEPDRMAWIARHPQQAAELASYFTEQDHLHRLAKPLRAAAPPELGGEARVLGDYELLEEIARGGMGVVYKARQISLNRIVALKLILAGEFANPGEVQRFRAEAEAVAALDQPNIVPIYDVGAHHGRHFFSMKLFNGGSLNQHLSRFVADPRAASILVATIARGVHHAHQRGILHRDLKPSNILLDADGQPHITDFGLAKRIDAGSDLTGTGALVGSPSYMAPEQTLGKKGTISVATDVHGLGTILYAALTGRPPFEADSVVDAIEQIQSRSPDPPKGVNPLVNRDLQTICLKCLEKAPERRYASAERLADDLELWLAGKPIAARPASQAERAWRWCRRKPVVASLLATVGVLLIAGFSGLSVSNRMVLTKNAEIKQALTQAQAREAETAAVLEFVEKNVFSAARPKGLEGGLGREVPLRQALAAALPFVGKRFSDQPLIEARLRRTMGLSFRYLGDEDVAAEQFEAARTLYTKHRGAEHPDTLASMNNLGNSYAALGRHADALKLRQETLALREASLGPDHPDTLASMSNLANSYAALGRHADGLTLREDTLRIRKEKLGPDHPDTLASMNNLAISYTVLGRHDAAAKLQEETLVLQQAKFPRGHPRVLACMNNLAESYQALGQHADALKLYDETLSLAKASLGPNHGNTLLIMNNLAWLLSTAEDVRFRDPARAVELAAHAAKSQPDNAVFAGTLGTARFRTGDFKQAALDLEKAISLRSPSDTRNANESFFLAMARWCLGDKPGAQTWFDKGKAWMEQDKSRHDELRRFRAEAAELLSINDATKPN
jgi:eukaryotic-like serine/threonine-protein kinase